MHVDQFSAECMGGLKAWEHVESPCVSVELEHIIKQRKELRHCPNKFKLLSDSYFLLDSYLRQEIA